MIGTIVTALAASWLVWAEWRDDASRVAAKPIASLGFLLVPILEGLSPGSASRWIMVGLVLGAVGDVALLMRSSAAFLTGLGAFLLGHLAYVVAFAEGGVTAGPALVAGAVMTVVGAVTLWQLRPHLEAPFTIAVPLYVLVIGAMVVTATGSRSFGVLAALGAAVFAASDLFVARDRFVTADRWNAVLGLPLYYAGQLAIAWAAVLTTG